MSGKRHSRTYRRGCGSTAAIRPRQERRCNCAVHLALPSPAEATRAPSEWPSPFRTGHLAPSVTAFACGSSCVPCFAACLCPDSQLRQPATAGPGRCRDRSRRICRWTPPSRDAGAQEESALRRGINAKRPGRSHLCGRRSPYPAQSMQPHPRMRSRGGVGARRDRDGEPQRAGYAEARYRIRPRGGM
jgi:hypothetical protein